MAQKRSSSRKRSNPRTQKKKPDSNKTLILAVVVIVIAVVGIAAGVMLLNQSPADSDDTNGNQNNNLGENPTAIIDTSMGMITVELYQDKVPNTCENFIDYANDNFYDGLVFHRVANLIPDQPDTHIIQGGGYYPDGTRKETNNPIDLEIHPDARHVDGAIAMARTNDPNSATSQFYICDGPQSFLDDNYAVFGIVVDGMDVVRSIATVDTTTKNGMQKWPVNDVIITSITIEE